MTSLPSRPTPDVRVELRGALPREEAEHARRRMLGLLDRLAPAGRPDPAVHSARVKLTRSRSSEVARPAIAQATLGLAGRKLRTQVAAVTMHQAVRLLHDRLLDRASRLRPYWEAPPDAAPPLDPDLCRPSREVADRPEYARRTLGEREIVRRKSVRPARLTPQQAVLAMAGMDFDFHLFADAVTGQDCLVHCQDPTGGYRIVRAGGAGQGGTTAGTAWSVAESLHPAPRIGVTEAARRLWLSGRPFVFFTGLRDGRGRILYRRYDGHYGLIVPGQ
ncbi:sigma 54 modulation/S30EA ribosomal C-terminal domain-containing protein [Kitasatospora sp. NPDC056138]|uniref:sigma 54 modulation/S30EA ribosomal C-terminal domain-containing protein n=1 Tax=Kitasatospora sp. NPDC056138 TaxID=3345724 RepID=UPI0035DD7630